MLQLSSQNITNLVNYQGIVSSSSTANSLWNQYLIFVSDQLAFPTDTSEAYLYINKALNCSAYGNSSIAASGDAGYVTNCLGIAGFSAKSGTIMNNSAFVMNGPVEFVAKQSGTIGGVIITQLQGSSSSAVVSSYPIANASTLTQYNTLSGDTGSVNMIWNYIAITDSISTTGDGVVIVSDTTLTQGESYTLYSASLSFSGV